MDVLKREEFITSVSHKWKRKGRKKRKREISERDVPAGITRGGGIGHERRTYHVGVGSALCVAPTPQNEDDSQLSFPESSPVLRSLRHAQPPSLMLAGFSWRAASSLHGRILSSAFNSSPLLRLLLKGGPLFSLKSYRRIDRLLGHSTGGRRDRGVAPAYASPWRFFPEHARFQTYPAEKQKFIPDLRPLIWWRPEFKAPPPSPLRFLSKEVFEDVIFSDVPCNEIFECYD